MQVVSGRLTERSRLITQNNDLTRSPHGHCIKKYIWLRVIIFRWGKMMSVCVWFNTTPNYLLMCVRARTLCLCVSSLNHLDPPNSWPLLDHWSEVENRGSPPRPIRSVNSWVAVTTAWPAVTPIRPATDRTGSWNRGRERKRETHTHT